MKTATMALYAAGLALGIGGCGDEPGGAPDAGAGPDTTELPYAREVVSFAAGDGAGFGASDMPEVVLGPPVARGPLQGSLDVVSLGEGGEIVLGFAGRTLFDGPGADLIVFENVFWQDDDPSRPWAELGEVAVSADGEDWTAWPCDLEGEGDGGATWPGCAGWRPTLEFDPFALGELDPAVTGGDPFDLSDIGVGEARFVRIRDLRSRSDGEEPSAGFDLDAVGSVHWR